MCCGHSGVPLEVSLSDCDEGAVVATNTPSSTVADAPLTPLTLHCPTAQRQGGRSRFCFVVCARTGEGAGTPSNTKHRPTAALPPLHPPTPQPLQVTHLLPLVPSTSPSPPDISIVSLSSFTSYIPNMSSDGIPPCSRCPAVYIFHLTFISSPPHCTRSTHSFLLLPFFPPAPQRALLH